MRWFNKPSRKTIKNDSPYERCILCGKSTKILKVTPIEDRQFYIYGSGQMCQSCYFSVYVRPEELVRDEFLSALKSMLIDSEKR